MKNILIRIAVVALFAAGSLAPLSAEPKQAPQKPQIPIPVCWPGNHCTPDGN